MISATANTLLSSIGGFTIGFLAAAWWYGAHKNSRRAEMGFDERDIYSKPKVKKFVSK